MTVQRAFGSDLRANFTILMPLLQSLQLLQFDLPP